MFGLGFTILTLLVLPVIYACFIIRAYPILLASFGHGQRNNRTTNETCEHCRANKNKLSKTIMNSTGIAGMTAVTFFTIYNPG